MFSTHAPVSSRNLAIFFLILISLVTFPQFSAAQTGDNTEDPPPILYRPDASGGGSALPLSYICRSPFGDAGGALFCAGEVSLAAGGPVDVTGSSAMYTFVLATHETVAVETSGSSDTFGELLDAEGRRVGVNDDGGSQQNFRITKTLPPGRYYVRIVSDSSSEVPTRLQIARKRPLGGAGPHAGPGEDVGNHCGGASEIATFSTTAASFERPGDVDVFSVRLSEASDLLIAVDGAARYELKAADCLTSLGLASSGLGATLAPLSEGTYYLYVSHPEGSTGGYQLRVEGR